MHIIYIADVKEKFYFGEESTERTNFKSVVVNIARTCPACDATVISLNVSFESSGLVLCKYNVLQSSDQQHI